jgi:L-threonylcarbamoyladenylate synthase
LTLLLKGPEEANDWVPQLSPVGKRLATRLWPGPLTLLFSQNLTESLASRLPAEVRSLISPQGDLALRSPSDSLIRNILRLTPGPLVLGMVANPDQSVAVTADVFRDRPEIDMVIDSGPTQFGKASTLVRIENERWSIEREGVIDARTLVQMSGLIILFVCTGNTCRSPMAEAICKVLLARRRNCSIDQLEESGYVVRSAGVAAVNGAPAAVHAAEVLRTMGGSLEHHRSQRITADLVRQADCIFAMTTDHLEALLEAVPEAENHTFLLDPHGEDVHDPIGSDHHNYQLTAQIIEQMMQHRLDELGL